MTKAAREQGISLKSLFILAIKNTFSMVYFMIVGTIIAIVYTQLIFKPTFEAEGNIENIGAVSTALMSTIPTIVEEHQTIENVINKLEISGDDVDGKVQEIKSGLMVTSYDSASLKIKIVYSGNNKTEVEDTINFIIEATIERFIERNPSLDGKIQKQSNAIVAYQAGPSNILIYMVFIIIGMGFGLTVGVGRDLMDRKIISMSDLLEYKTPINSIKLKRENKDKEVLKMEEISKNIPKILEELEETSKKNKIKIIAIVNLGKNEIELIINNFAQETNNMGFKTLVVDLNLDNPIIHEFYNVDSNSNLTNITTNGDFNPIKLKNNLEILPTLRHQYPARFLKDQRVVDIFNTFRENYDYVFIALPSRKFYSPILFSQNSIDSLLISVSFGSTKVKDLDEYISNIEPALREKIYINAIDSSIKQPLSNILKNIKTKFINFHKKR